MRELKNIENNMILTYKEAKPFLRDGMTVRVIKNECKNHFVNEIVTIRGGGMDTPDTYCSFTVFLKVELEILTNPDGTPWVDPYAAERSEQPFKVGDRVRHDDNEGCSEPFVGVIGEISNHIYVWHNDENHRGSVGNIKLPPQYKYSWSTDESHLEKIEDKPNKNNMATPPPEFYKSISEPQAQKETNQMSVVKMIKAKFSPTDKTLVKHGYLTDKGERTSMYEQELKDAAIADLIEAQDTKSFRQELASALIEE